MDDFSANIGLIYPTIAQTCLAFFVEFILLQNLCTCPIRIKKHHKMWSVEMIIYIQSLELL